MVKFIQTPCAREGCTKTRWQPANNHGNERLYCSDECRFAAASARMKGNTYSALGRNMRGVWRGKP